MKKRKLLKKGIWKKEGRKGFSLGEVLLTVAILGILAAIAVPSIGYFSRLLNQMKLDNTAREIFISAQNKMITMKSCGMDLPDGTSMGLDMPADYDEAVMGAWPNRGTDESIHPFRYVFSAYAAFMEDTLLGKDKQEGEYVIEFNRNTGDVYAVFYWEPQEVDFGGKSSFVYASPNNTYTEGDKTYRIREDKKERMNSGLKVGYYGGNAAAMTKAEEFAYDAKIINADKLQLRLMPEDEELGEHTRYVITIRSATDTENKEEYTFGLQYDGSTTTHSVTFEATGAIKEIGTLPKNVEALHDVSKKERGFLVTLDSVEEGQHFANLFPKIAAGDDISIQVQAYYLGTDQVCIAKQNYELTDNSLFARVRQETEEDGVKINPQGKDVVITTGRHLQNLSEKASHLGYITDKNNNQAQIKTKYPIVHAKLNANIDWTNEAYNYSEKNTLYDGKELLESFQPIDISDESKIDTRIFDGNGRTISNLSITERSTTAAGLFGIVKDDLTVRNLKLKDCTVNTTDVSDTGMLVGRVDMNTTSQTVSIQNCGVFLSDKTEYNADEYQVENVAEKKQSSNVGGFVGNLQKGNLKIQDSFSAVNVRSTAKDDSVSSNANASGFVGLITNGTLSIDNAYTSCIINAEGKLGACAGGLAGYFARGTITASSCFTTCDVSAKTNNNGKGYSGGAFGYLNCKATLTNMQSYGLVSLQGGDNLSQIGGLVGKFAHATSNPSCTNCSYLSMKDYNSFPEGTGYNHETPPLPYNAMPKGTDANKKLTFAYLADLKNEPFPFALMKKKDSNENLPYYGNWPTPTKETEGVVGLCYYEKYGENDYGVFISGVDMAKKGPVYVDTLVYEPTSTKRVQESGYCIAAKGKGISALNGYTSLASLPSLAGYQFYQLADSTPNTAGVCNVSLNGVSFYYQPDFAAAISRNAGKYASDLAAYQIRTEEQLAKVGTYKGYAFHQTMNIDIETINGDSLIAEIPAATTLDGQGSHFNGKTEVSPVAPYTITMETALPDENVGLIGSNQGTLKNLVLEGQTDNNDFLVVQNEGTIENCIANHADLVMQRAENP